jgi:glycine betaine/choline ABC-type transport system substrate-binding protein
VVPIFSKKTTAAEGPAFSQTINAVSAKLTVPAMQQMNAAVDLDKNNPAEVAKKFLQANNLL